MSVLRSLKRKSQYHDLHNWLTPRCVVYSWLNEILCRITEEETNESPSQVDEGLREGENERLLAELYLRVFELLCKNNQILSPILLSTSNPEREYLANLIRRRQIEVLENNFHSGKQSEGLLRVILHADLLPSPLFENFSDEFGIDSIFEKFEHRRKFEKILDEYFDSQTKQIEQTLKDISRDNQKLQIFLSLNDTELKIISELLHRGDILHIFAAANTSRPHRWAESLDHDDFKFRLGLSCNPKLIEIALAMDGTLVRLNFIEPIFQTDDIAFKLGPFIENLIWENKRNSDFTPDKKYSELISSDGITMDQVILPSDVKQYIESLLSAHKSHDESIKRIFDSLLFCFQGKSGTGKTMLAKAIASTLKYKIIRINGGKATPEYLKYLLQKTRGKELVLLFDECDALLGRNPFTGKNDAWAKILFEDFRGVVIFTTNHPLSRSLLRRMTFVYNFEYQSTQHKLQILNQEVEKILGAIPADCPSPAFTIDDFGVDCETLGLTGGYFKQAIQLSLSKSWQSNSKPTLQKNDVVTAIKYLDKQIFKTEQLREVKIPKIRLDDIVLPQELQTTVRLFIDYAKQNTKLIDRQAPPAAIFLHGPPGTGKTILAEGIANALEREIVTTSGASFLGPYVGMTEENIKNTFREADNKSQLLFIDEVDALFQTREKATQSWQVSAVNEFLLQIEQFKGVLVVATNFKKDIDPAFLRRFIFHIEMNTPDSSERFLLWQKHTAGLMISNEILTTLSECFQLSGGDIRNISYRARAFGFTSWEALAQECKRELAAKGSSTKKIGLV